MKNTKIINKYALATGVLLFAVVFSVALPFAARADDGSGWITDPTINGGSDWVTDPTIDGGSDWITDPTINGGSENIIITGGFSGGNISGVYPLISYYPYSSTVTSGSFSGGTLYQVVAPAGQYPGSTVTTGSFSGSAYYPYSYQSNLFGSCSANISNGAVTWNASASGGNGVYNYYWTGDYGLSGTGQYLSESYSTAGVKNATVTITSGDGQSISRTCSVNLGVGNQVLAYSATNPTLQSVYLSNVPYTGAGDMAKVIGFLSTLLLWSAGLAYIFLKRKEKMENQVVAVSVEKSDSNGNTDYLQNFRMEINSDSQAIESIETYARMNKVLLSSDALIELAKLVRLNKINPKEAIKKMARGEWAAVGENDLQKYL